MMSSLPAWAQPPAVQGIPALTKSLLKQELRWTIAYKKPVRVGALMTKRERKQFFRAMQTAKTLEARQQIREFAYARLRQRAAERGMFVVPHTAQKVATVPVEAKPQQVRVEAKPKVGTVVVREPVRIVTKPAVARVIPTTPHPAAPAHPAPLPPPKH